MISLLLYGLYQAWPVIAFLLVFAIVCSIGGRKKERRALFPCAPMKYQNLWLTREEFDKRYPHRSYDAYVRRSERKHRIS